MKNATGCARVRNTKVGFEPGGVGAPSRSFTRPDRLNTPTYTSWSSPMFTKPRESQILQLILCGQDSDPRHVSLSIHTDPTTAFLRPFLGFPKPPNARLISSPTSHVRHILLWLTIVGKEGCFNPSRHVKSMQALRCPILGGALGITWL